MFEYRVGDIVGIWANAFEGAVLHLESPYSPAFHHLLVGPYVPEENDWIILESINSGVRIGRLSWYRGRMAIVYRAPEHIQYGQEIFNRATVYGRKGYDYLQLLKLLIWGIPRLINNHFRPIPFYEIPSDNEDAVICTELVARAYYDYWVIVSSSIAATPAAIYAAFLSGKLDLVYEGKIEAGYEQASWVQHLQARLAEWWRLICRA